MPLAPLDTRTQEILKNIVAHYILTGEPVGSRLIARMSSEGLSPASIRNVMADLEELGFLSQPHTSAGRVPTDRGYRYYVDSLVPQGVVGSSDRAVIETQLSRLRGELDEAMEVVPRLLSHLTHQVGYLVTPPIAGAVLKHIEFVRLHTRRILVVFVDRSEMVSHRVLDTGEDYAQEDLTQAGRYLVTEFAGLSISEIRQRLVKLMAEEKATFDRMLKNAVDLGTLYAEAEAGQRRLVLEGTSNIMEQPEFADVETMRRLFQTFEQKHRLVHLLDRCLERPGVQVVIGSESEDPALGKLSLVASPFGAGEGPTGLLGVLGPTRMEYARAVALVDYISRIFSNLLTRHTG